MENANLLCEGGPENPKRIAGLILLQAAEARAEAAEAAAAAALEQQGAVEAALGLDRIVALYYCSSASYQIC